VEGKVLEDEERVAGSPSVQIDTIAAHRSFSFFLLFTLVKGGLVPRDERTGRPRGRGISFVVANDKGCFVNHKSTYPLRGSRT
jgi:hypothetical protein